MHHALERFEPLIDLTVRGLLQERSDIDPARAEDLRADLRRHVAASIGPGEPSIRLVLESGWLGPNGDRLVNSYGWRVERRELARGTREAVFLVDAENRFHLGASERFPVQYCAFSGPDAGPLCALVSTRLSFLTLDDLTQAARAAASEDERCAVVWAIGAAATQPGPFTARYIRRCLSDDSSRVRLAAIEAAALTGWAELARDLDAIAASDADEALRGAAAESAAILRSVDAGGDE